MPALAWRRRRSITTSCGARPAHADRVSWSKPAEAQRSSPLCVMAGYGQRIAIKPLSRVRDIGSPAGQTPPYLAARGKKKKKKKKGCSRTTQGLGKGIRRSCPRRAFDLPVLIAAAEFLRARVGWSSAPLSSKFFNQATATTIEGIGPCRSRRGSLAPPPDRLTVITRSMTECLMSAVDLPSTGCGAATRLDPAETSAQFASYAVRGKWIPKNYAEFAAASTSK